MTDIDTQSKGRRSHRVTTRLRRKLKTTKRETILGYAIITILLINPYTLSKITRKTKPIPLAPLYSISNNNAPNNPSYELARQQSYGFFNQIPQDEWEIKQQIVRDYIPHKYPNNPMALNPEAEDELKIVENVPRVRKRAFHYLELDLTIRYVSWYQNNYDPNFSCSMEQRVGGNGNGDGPKWTCDPQRLIQISQERKNLNPNQPGCVVYSIGSNGDFTFETGLQRLIGVDTCDIHIFDFGDYEKDMPKELKATYHQWGLDDEVKANSDSSFKTLKQTVEILGHDKLDSNTIDIFKIDCEGCEWTTHKDWFGEGIPMLQQILVEVHRAPKDHVLPFFDGMRDAGYVTFHKESNIEFEPSCLEYGFIKLHDDFFLPKVKKESDYYDYVDDIVTAPPGRGHEKAIHVNSETVAEE